MRLYWEIARRGYRRYAAYAAATVHLAGAGDARRRLRVRLDRPRARPPPHRAGPSHRGHVGQRIQLWWDLPLRDSFELLRHIYRVPEARYRENLDRFIDVRDLDVDLEEPAPPLEIPETDIEEVVRRIYVESAASSAPVRTT